MKIRQVEREHRLRDRPGLTLEAIVIHTTGIGIYRRDDPLEWVLDYYTRQALTPHFVVATDGRVYQVAPLEARANHVGMSLAERLSYRTGRWRRKIPRVAEHWDRAWPLRRSPLDLLPGQRSVNACTIGIEVIPRPSREFTVASYIALDELVRTLQTRLGVRECYGHEDLNPLRRPGNDPGALREAPFFDWRWIAGVQTSRQWPPEMTT